MQVITKIHVIVALLAIQSTPVLASLFGETCLNLKLGFERLKEVSIQADCESVGGTFFQSSRLVLNQAIENDDGMLLWRKEYVFPALCRPRRKRFGADPE